MKERKNNNNHLSENIEITGTILYKDSEKVTTFTTKAERSRLFDICSSVVYSIIASLGIDISTISLVNLNYTDVNVTIDYNIKNLYSRSVVSFDVSSTVKALDPNKLEQDKVVLDKEVDMRLVMDSNKSSTGTLGRDEALSAIASFIYNSDVHEGWFSGMKVIKLIQKESNKE